MDRGKAICEELKKAGIHHLVWLPDSETHFMNEAIIHDPGIKVIQVCREGEAIAICAGLYMGGSMGALLVENQGILECGNVLKWSMSLNIPMVMLIGYFGFYNFKRTEQGMKRSSGQMDYTEPFLAAFGIKYFSVYSDADVANVGVACNESRLTSMPVGLLLSSADGYGYAASI